MFRPLTEAILVSPQISVADVEQAKAMGVTFILNNRPDDEEPGQVNGAEIAAAAQAAGIGYAAWPCRAGQKMGPVHCCTDPRCVRRRNIGGTGRSRGPVPISISCRHVRHARRGRGLPARLPG